MEAELQISTSDSPFQSKLPLESLRTRLYRRRSLYPGCQMCFNVTQNWKTRENIVGPDLFLKKRKTFFDNSLIFEGHFGPDWCCMNEVPCCTRRACCSALDSLCLCWPPAHFIRRPAPASSSPTNALRAGHCQNCAGKYYSVLRTLLPRYCAKLAPKNCGW